MSAPDDLRQLADRMGDKCIPGRPFGFCGNCDFCVAAVALRHHANLVEVIGPRFRETAAVSPPPAPTTCPTCAPWNEADCPDPASDAFLPPHMRQVRATPDAPTDSEHTPPNDGDLFSYRLLMEQRVRMAEGDCAEWKGRAEASEAVIAEARAERDAALAEVARQDKVVAKLITEKVAAEADNARLRAAIGDPEYLLSDADDAYRYNLTAAAGRLRRIALAATPTATPRPFFPPRSERGTGHSPAATPVTPLSTEDAVRLLVPPAEPTATPDRCPTCGCTAKVNRDLFRCFSTIPDPWHQRD